MKILIISMTFFSCLGLPLTDSLVYAAENSEIKMTKSEKKASFFRPKYGMAGCGLGAIIVGPRGSQVFAATTNNTYYNQGFAITSGTSQCFNYDELAAVRAQEEFISSNLNILSKEMAQGDGVYLRSFASIMGCQESTYLLFARKLQGAYSRIFAAPGAMSVLQQIRQEIATDEDLSLYCPSQV